MFDRTLATFHSSLLGTRSACIAAAIATLIGSMYMYLSRKKNARRVICPVDPQNQSIILPGPEGIRVFALPEDQILKLPDGITTVHEAFVRGVKLAGNKHFLGTPEGGGKYKWLTYSEVFKKASNVGSALVELGLSPSQESRVGICSHNRVEWVLAERASYMYSMIVVPVYDTFGPDACMHIINETSLPVLFCESSKLSPILDIADQCPSLKHIIKIGGAVTEEERNRVNNVNLMSFEDLEALGFSHPHELKPPSPEDLFTICYTSGTTGKPKGVMLTHANIIAATEGTINSVKEGLLFCNEDIHLSFLPLAHMYERAVHIHLSAYGVRIAFWSGDAKNLLQDLQLIRPTLFFGVPRLLNKIYDKVMAGVNAASSVKKALFYRALRSKEYEMKQLNIVRNDSIWDILVFRKIQNIFGGRVRFLGCGSAPLSGQVLSFFRCTLGCKCYEGYGQTECTLGATMQVPGDYKEGHVGPPIVRYQIKLVDVAEKNYFANNNQGEICLKGPQVFKGYFNNPEKTAETLDEDGWLHTGDIGEWTPEGTLKIIDRKKNIFKLSQGEYIAPERIENIYLRSSLVAQAFVHGDSLQWCTVGIAVPDEEVLCDWAKKNNISGDFQQLCDNEIVKKAILDDMTKEGKEAQLKSFEQIKDLYLCAKAFTLEDGLITPTFKPKREALLKNFNQQIISMYEKVNK